MQVSYRSVFFVIIIVASQFFADTCHAQDFEGEVTFMKKSLEDTTYYAYIIKGNKIRIDELDKKLQLINYMIVDVPNRSIYAINPKRKLYVDMPVRPFLYQTDTTNFIILKTENYKTIKGYKCYQWRVRNKKENTEIAYWVSPEHFRFFADFLKILNRSEKSSIYYLHIPESGEFFPLLSVERSLLREWRMCLEVLSIEKKNLSSSLFEIPQGYKLFQKK